MPPLLVQCASTHEERGAPICDEGRGVVAERDGFTRYAIDGAADGPAFVAVGDVDGDGRKDIVVSSLGAVTTDGAKVTLSRGHVSAYLQGATLACWHKVEIVGDAAGMYFTNRPTLADVDGNGDLDLIQPAGFFVCTFDEAVGKCGAIAWFENDGHAAGWKRHDVVPFGDAFFYHKGNFVDFDGDGVSDLVTVGESQSRGARAIWFKGDRSADRFDRTPRAIGDGLGSFPIVIDVDGDGDLDVASAEYFVDGSSFAWFERVASPSADAPAGQWTRHVVNDDSGRGFMLDLVPNLFGDGVTRAIATNHTNASDDAKQVESSVFVLAPGVDPRMPWRKTRISEGVVSRKSVGNALQGAPGVFGWGDLDGDGDIDIALAGDGDVRAFWMEQTTPGTFAMHTLEPSLGQAAGAVVTDVDGDGTNEMIFTGYEDDQVLVYARTR